MGARDLTIAQGETLRHRFAWKIRQRFVDLTSYTAHLQIRPTIASDIVLLDLTDGDGLTLGGTAGTIDVFIPADVTAALGPDWPTVNHRLTAVYGIELTSSGGEVHRLLQSNAYLDPEVVR